MKWGKEETFRLTLRLLAGAFRSMVMLLAEMRMTERGDSLGP